MITNRASISSAILAKVLENTVLTSHNKIVVRTYKAVGHVGHTVVPFYFLFNSSDIADTIGYLLMGSSEQASQEIEVSCSFMRHCLVGKKLYSLYF